MEPTLGQKLLLAAGDTTSEAVLVAPFVKVDALRRILGRIPDSASVKVVARWIPGEILAGVCDLEIYDLITSRANSELFTHPLLHAKSYRFDDLVYIGSANITSKALGWAHPANLEILEPAGEQSQNIITLERKLLATAIKVDASYRNEMERLVHSLEEQIVVDKCFFEAHIASNSCWLPKCRDPRRLWLVYSESQNAKKRIVESAYNAAIEDLAALEVPSGLTLGEFRDRIAITLNGIPLVKEITLRASEGLTDADSVKLISEKWHFTDDGYNPSDQWEVLREWLLEFFPNAFRRETYPNVFRSGKIIR